MRETKLPVNWRKARVKRSSALIRVSRPRVIRTLLQLDAEVIPSPPITRAIVYFSARELKVLMGLLHLSSITDQMPIMVNNSVAPFPSNTETIQRVLNTLVNRPDKTERLCAGEETNVVSLVVRAGTTSVARHLFSDRDSAYRVWPG